MPLRPRFLSLVAVLVCLSALVRADNKTMIDSNASMALDNLRSHSTAVGDLLSAAAGVLIFPDIVRMRFGEGGQYGEGSLLVGSAPVAYYATAKSDLGLPYGGQEKAEVILFMTEEVLQQFRNGLGWEVGADAAVTPVPLGVGGSLDTASINEPILSLVFSDSGLSYNLPLEGSKITRIAR